MSSPPKRARPVSMDNAAVDARVDAVAGDSLKLPDTTKKARIGPIDGAEATLAAIPAAARAGSQAEALNGSDLPDKLPDELPNELDLYDPRECPVLMLVYGKEAKPGQAPLLEKTYREYVKWQGAKKRAPSARLLVDDGTLEWGRCVDPFGDEPYEILIGDMKSDVDIKLASNERQFPCKVDKVAKGWEIELEIEEVPCMGDIGKGFIKIQKAWEGENGEALYECFLYMKVKYGPRTRKGGHGSGETRTAGMWAIASPTSAEEGIH